MIMAGKKRITLQIRGRDTDNGDVRFDDFIKQLGAVKSALTETGRVVSEKASVYFKVVDLRHASPASIVLEAVSISVRENMAEAIIEKFFASLDDIERGIAPSGFDYEAFQAFKDMTTLLGKKKLTEIKVSPNGGASKSLEYLAHNVDQILGPDEYEIGSLTGMLEQINVHLNQNMFTIYPTTHHPKVRCVFTQTLRKDAIHAVGEYVRVTGRMKYKTKLRGAYPYEIAVEGLEVYPPEDELPTLDDLRGIIPSGPNDPKSEDIIGKIRGEW